MTRAILAACLTAALLVAADATSAELAPGPELALPPPEMAPAAQLDRMLVATDWQDYLAVLRDWRGGRAARFTQDGTIIDPGGFPLPLIPEAVIWTGTHYLIAGRSDGGTSAVSTVTVSRGGDVTPVHLTAREDELEAWYTMDMATTGRTVAIALGRHTVLITDPDGRLQHVVRTGCGGAESAYYTAVTSLGGRYAAGCADRAVDVVMIDEDGTIPFRRTVADSSGRPGLALGSDGRTITVAWTDSAFRTRTQQLTSDGGLAGPARDPGIGDALDLRLERYGGSLLLTFRLGWAAPQNYGLRLARNGAPAGPIVAIGEPVTYSRPELAVRPDGTAVAVWVDHELHAAAALIDVWPATGARLESSLNVGLSPRRQDLIRVAAAGSGFVAAWRETEASTPTVKLGVPGSLAPPLVVTVGDVYLRDVLLAVDSSTIWVLYSDRSGLSVRRYTLGLTPIDPAGVRVAPDGYYRVAATGGGAVVLVAYLHKVTATLLRPAGESIAATTVVLDENGYAPVLSAGVWDGEAFTLAWTRPVSNERNELRATRISADGRLLSLEPRTIGDRHVSYRWLVVAPASEGATVVWGETRSDSSASAVYARRYVDLSAHRNLDLPVGGSNYATLAADGTILLVTTFFADGIAKANILSRELSPRHHAEVPVARGSYISSAAFSGGTLLVAIQRTGPEPPFGTFRVFTAPSKRRAVR